MNERVIKNVDVATASSWIKEIADPVLANECDANKMEILIKVALQCVEEDKDARPSTYITFIIYSIVESFHNTYLNGHNALQDF